MRYTILINQPKALEWGLNLAETVVFTFLYGLPSWAKSSTFQDEQFYFASRNKALEEIPIVSNKADAIYRHYKTLVEKGLVAWKKFDGKDYIKLTEKAKTWEKFTGTQSDCSEKNPKKFGKISENNSEKFPTYNNTNKDKERTIKEIAVSSETTPIQPQAEISSAAVPNKDIKHRQRVFEESLVPFLEKYGKKMLREFSDYWTESNTGGNKMRWEMQKVFDVARRLQTWQNRSETFGKPVITPTDEKEAEAVAQIFAKNWIQPTAAQVENSKKDIRALFKSGETLETFERNIKIAVKMGLSWTNFRYLIEHYSRLKEIASKQTYALSN